MTKPINHINLPIIMSTEKIKVIYESAVVNLAHDTIKKSKQALVFVNTKSSAEKTAEEIAKTIEKSLPEHEELSDKALNTLANPTEQCIRLSKCLKKGIAFHHAGLLSKQKELIEESFKKGAIKIICATPTLAAGLDLPAFRTIIRDVKRYGHRGLAYIPVLEYLQMAGRAGRPKYDKFGESIIVAASESDAEKLKDRYIKGEPEEIYSKLAVEPVLRTYLLSLIASEFINSKKDINAFFQKTFWAYQFGDMEHLEHIINSMLDLLEEWEFIKSSSAEFFISAEDLDKEDRYEAAPIGKRVAELYIDPLTAHDMMECLKKHTIKSIKEFSFLQMVSHTLEMRPLLKVKVKEYEDIQEILVTYHDSILEDEPSMYDPEYEDFISSVKTASFFNEWIQERTEQELLEKYSIRPGEIRIKLGTADWLLYATEELARMMHYQSLLSEIRKLRIRVDYGVKEELLPLMKLKGVGRVRARKMFNNKIKDIGDVKKVDITLLSQILGKKIAVDIKNQVGENIKESPAEKPSKKKSTIHDYI